MPIGTGFELTLICFFKHEAQLIHTNLNLFPSKSDNEAMQPAL